MTRCIEHDKVMPHYRCDESEDFLDAMADELAKTADEIEAVQAEIHARLAGGELERRRAEIMARVKKRQAGR